MSRTNYLRISCATVVRLLRAVSFLLRLDHRRHRHGRRVYRIRREQHYHGGSVEADQRRSRLEPERNRGGDYLGIFWRRPAVAFVRTGGGSVWAARAVAARWYSGRPAAIGVSQSTAPWQFYATFVPARALTEFMLCGIVALHGDRQLVLRQTAARHGLGGDVDAVGLGGDDADLSVSRHRITAGAVRFSPLGLALLILVVMPAADFSAPPTRRSGFVSRRCRTDFTLRGNLGGRDASGCRGRAQLDARRGGADECAVVARGERLSCLPRHRRYRLSHGRLFYRREDFTGGRRRRGERDGALWGIWQWHLGSLGGAAFAAQFERDGDGVVARRRWFC